MGLCFGHGLPCPKHHEEEIKTPIVLMDFNAGLISAADY